MDHDGDAGAAAASLVLACGLLLKKKQHRGRRRWWMTSLLKNSTISGSWAVCAENCKYWTNMDRGPC